MRRLILMLGSAAAFAQHPLWRQDLSEIEATVNKIRAGRDLTPKQWPGGARVAVALSFDMDAETGFLRAGQSTPQPLSRGEYGPRVGIPRILDLLERYGIPATFFIPAVSGQLHPEAVDAILNSPMKHEIALHGWAHEALSELQTREERVLTQRSIQWWTRRLGRQPVGIRTPSWDFTAETLPIIRDSHLLYDSSLMGDDRPYEILADGNPTGIVELPVDWSLDDYAYYSYDRPSSAYYRIGDNEVFEIYRAEFDRAHQEGTMFLLTLHPFVSGRRSRVAALERLVEHMRSKGGVWFATHEQVAREVLRVARLSE